MFMDLIVYCECLFRTQCRVLKAHCFNVISNVQLERECRSLIGCIKAVVLLEVELEWLEQENSWWMLDCRVFMFINFIVNGQEGMSNFQGIDNEDME